MGFSLHSPLITETSLLVFAAPGIGSNRVELIQLKIVLFAPIPSASVITATAVKPGFFASIRKPKRAS